MNAPLVGWLVYVGHVSLRKRARGRRTDVLFHCFSLSSEFIFTYIIRSSLLNFALYCFVCASANCQLVFTMQHDPSSNLIECLDWNHEHPNFESSRQHALEIIRSGGDIHSVTKYKETCLHLAVSNNFLDVVQLLLEKGIDVNAQTTWGCTALHIICQKSCAESELVPMLLYYGADPWIWNECNCTALDAILRFRFHLRNSDVEKLNLIATIEHLFYYMFDQYTEFGLSVFALLKVAYLPLPVFKEMVGTIKEVDLDNLESIGNQDMGFILMMPSENLRLLLEKFDYVLTALFLSSDPDKDAEVLPENVCILVGSHLQGEFIDWLRKWEVDYCFLDSLFSNPAPLASREDVVYLLLSCGMEVHERDVEKVYKHCGYNELFKFLRFMDVKTRPDYPMRNLIPRLVFQVTGDIQKSIEDPWFWVCHINKLCYEGADYSKNSYDSDSDCSYSDYSDYSENCDYSEHTALDVKSALTYYCVPNLKDLRRKVEVERRKKFCKDVLDQPRIPLLVEMARNVFRKYFVQRLGITSAKQFYLSLELLPISSLHRKIIALETELY